MRSILPVCAAALLPALAVAADDVGHWYMTPSVGGVSVDDRRGIADKDWLYGLHVGRNFSQAFSAELSFDQSHVKGNGPPGINLWSGAVDFLGVVGRDRRFAPYALVGVGALHTDRKLASDATDLMAEAGVGAFATLWRSGDGARSLQLRPEFKVRFSDAGADRLRDYVATLGLQYTFGAPDPVPVAAAPPPPVAEAPAPVVMAPPPPPPDSDGDGVIDAADKCPDTPAGVAVDLLGCPRQGSITLEGVTFETGSARLASESQTALEAVSTELKRYPRLRIELQGHTDSTGSAGLNQRLSQQRAESVRQYMLNAGVPAGQLIAKGYGQSLPIESNDTVEGRSKNRRVVMFVTSNPGNVKVDGAGEVP
ncbi:MAG: OmpA family protein [Steroidobacteraceae bacterium]